jgi:translation initiation factor IF-2
MLSLLEPEVKEVELGKAEVRQVFTIGKTTKIAGCYVTEGKIVRSKDAKLIRDGEVIFEGAIDQLKRFKDDVKEVAQGFECGISFNKFNDIQVGDIIEVSTTEEVERKSL